MVHVVILPDGKGNDTMEFRGATSGKSFLSGALLVGSWQYQPDLEPGSPSTPGQQMSEPVALRSTGSQTNGFRDRFDDRNREASL